MGDFLVDPNFWIMVCMFAVWWLDRQVDKDKAKARIVVLEAKLAKIMTEKSLRIPYVPDYGTHPLGS